MSKRTYFLVGIFLILIFYTPYIILMDNSCFKIHDYLEQDFVYVYLNSKYLFHPLQLNIPELFNGTYHASIQGHSFIQPIIYKIFKGVPFLIFNMIFASILGYTGLFLLLHKLYDVKNNLYSNIIITGSSFIFSIAPLLLHGATVMSEPMLAYILLTLNKNLNNKELVSYSLLSFFLGLSTSLIYGNFIFLVFYIALISYYLIKNKYNIVKNYLASLFCLLGGFIFTFFYSFLSLSQTSHREDWVLTKHNFGESFLSFLQYGYKEVPSYHLISFILLIFSIVLYIKFRRLSKEQKYSLITMLFILLITLFATIFTCSETVTNIRMQMGGILKSIQLTRVLYLINPCWYVIFASSLLYLNKITMCVKFRRKKTIKLLVIFAILLGQFFTIYSHNVFYKHTLSNMFTQKTKHLTYKDFFMQDMMNDIKNYINKPLSEYRVISLGINPGVPLFNGFYCLDGYSTNYPLAYKKDFNKVIYNELKKTKKYYDYFNNWGSRVYLYCNEASTFRPFIECSNNTIEVNNFDIDYSELKKLGADYILSRFKINNAEKFIKLEKTFMRNNQIVYLYKLN